VIPGLFEDSRVASLANPEKSRRRSGSVDEIDAAAIRVILDPFSAKARMRLGHMFAERSLDRCAGEQFAMAADLDEMDADAPLLAARHLHRIGNLDWASAMAERALSIDPDSEEAVEYGADSASSDPRREGG
jgi:hypothetical protein